MFTDADIARITSRIVHGYAPVVVGSFGSYAMGTARAQSDLDIFVIKQTAEDALTRRRVVQRLLFGVLYPLDIHVFTPSEFEGAAGEELSFAWVIARQAKLYYWSDDARRLVPALSLAFDTAA
jgi:predicted nucleotidyltransferase